MKIAAVTKSTLGSCFFCALWMGASSLSSSLLAADEGTAASPAQSVKRVLLLTGEDYPGHKWQETTPVLRAELAKDTRLSIQVVEDLKFLRSQDLHSFAAIVMHFKNYDPAVPGPEGQENLARFVRQGGGACWSTLPVEPSRSGPNSFSWPDASGTRSCEVTIRMASSGSILWTRTTRSREVFRRSK